MEQQKQINNEEDELSTIFKTTSFVNDRDSNFKKEESLAIKRQSQYKALSNDHEKRIKYFLERQKEKRRSLLTHVRSLISLPTTSTTSTNLDTNNITNNSNHGSSSDDTLMDDNDGYYSKTSDGYYEDETMDGQNENQNYTTSERKLNKRNKFKEINEKSKLSRKNKQALLYSNHLMLAEGMTIIPNDLEREWYCVPVPMGYRCLVISQNEETVVRSENGDIINQFQSLLPFGGEKSSENASHNNKYCILDCVYEDSTGTFYILDILAWKGFILYDCETEFRFFWRDSKIQEHQSITKYSDSNGNYRFIAPPYFTSNLDSFQQIKFDKIIKQQQQKSIEENQRSIKEKSPHHILDYNAEFLLFYHKNSHYEFGTTPLFNSLSIEYIDILIQNLNNKYQDENNNGSDEEIDED